jgi:uncharacterized membrane protein YsdA (DUF1294 family)
MYTQILIGIFVAINLFSFIVMGNDKRKSIRGGGADRTPEGFLFFMAVSFGAIGVFVGMQTFRHKTKKWYFQLGIPLLILQNLAVVYLIRELLTVG